MPRHLDHIALMVRDPMRTATWLGTLFDDARVTPGEGDHDTRVHLGGVCLALVAGEPPAKTNGDHIAFAVDADELATCAQRLKTQGRCVQLARGETALYFTDDDNHVFELDVVAEAR
ncbi:VOC family protein [Oleiagrimonas sp. MCCC 1A03011]|uniref:VOC family protein n=1 Tax=Oleiagrimonas sp. MCCC 1A03011 TaxID=1926883 RepID=UPI000DDB426E|nr:VOC family protein [Oleiagrimonas sp. MCCC 1A03011]